MKYKTMDRKVGRVAIRRWTWGESLSLYRGRHLISLTAGRTDIVYRRRKAKR